MSAGPTLVIVSGMSGAGRTTVMKALEDLGFYCVDNLPIVLLESFVDLVGERVDRLAAVVDVRSREFLSDFPDTHARLQRRGLLAELLFLDASDEILARRFGETRRVHPVAPSLSLPDAIAEERRLLALVSERAGAIVDTSDMSVHDLKRLVTRRYSGSSTGGRMDIELVSFGFRHGAPEQADLVLDVRFLPNPYYEPGLRERSGEAEEVAAYVLGSPRSRAFLDRLLDFLEFLIPLYEDEGKAYLAIAIGCTGGLHRSVAIVNALEGSLRERKIEARVRHRDLGRARRAIA